ncbi:MAG TPA: hypothetical protein VEZ12_07835 [Herpetosiphonaceae bacterium]|nr:hypothetical protein [Herpetosiphonaceae bacterium]
MDFLPAWMTPQFPTQQILVHDQTEETNSDRRRQREGWPAGTDDIPRPRSIGGALGQLAESCARWVERDCVPCPGSGE